MPSATWTSATALDAVLSTPLAGEATVTVGFEPTGSVVAGTVSFETSLDGATWLPFLLQSSGVAATVSTTSDLVGASGWNVAVLGWAFFRVRLSALVAGSGSVVVTLGTTGGTSAGTQVVVSASAAPGGNDTSAIAQAIAQAQAIGADTIYFPPRPGGGSWGLDGTLTAPTGIFFFQAHPGAVMAKLPGISAPVLSVPSGSTTFVQGGTWDGGVTYSALSGYANLTNGHGFVATAGGVVTLTALSVTNMSLRSVYATGAGAVARCHNVQQSGCTVNTTTNSPNAVGGMNQATSPCVPGDQIAAGVFAPTGGNLSLFTPSGTFGFAGTTGYQQHNYTGLSGNTFTGVSGMGTVFGGNTGCAQVPPFGATQIGFMADTGGTIYTDDQCSAMNNCQFNFATAPSASANCQLNGSSSFSVLGGMSWRASAPAIPASLTFSSTNDGAYGVIVGQAADSPGTTTNVQMGTIVVNATGAYYQNGSGETFEAYGATGLQVASITTTEPTGYGAAFNNTTATIGSITIYSAADPGVYLEKGSVVYSGPITLVQCASTIQIGTSSDTAPCTLVCLAINMIGNTGGATQGPNLRNAVNCVLIGSITNCTQAQSAGLVSIASLAAGQVSQNNVIRLDVIGVTAAVPSVGIASGANNNRVSLTTDAVSNANLTAPTNAGTNNLITVTAL